MSWGGTREGDTADTLFARVAAQQPNRMPSDQPAQLPGTSGRHKGNGKWPRAATRSTSDDEGRASRNTYILHLVGWAGQVGRGRGGERTSRESTLLLPNLVEIVF